MAMPSIDFYILPGSTVASYLDVTCRLVDKAYQQKHRVYIYTDHRPLASQIDAQL